MSADLESRLKSALSQLAAAQKKNAFQRTEIARITQDRAALLIETKRRKIIITNAYQDAKGWREDAAKEINAGSARRSKVD